MEAPAEFSLVLGGPLYRLLARSHLAGGPREQMIRRVVVLTLTAWVPLFALCAAAGTAWDGGRLTFLRDIEMQVRLLVALPLLIVAELVVHLRMRLVLSQFLDRGLIAEGSRAKFQDAFASTVRLRDSAVAEVILLAVVYAIGVPFLWRVGAHLTETSWYGVAAEGHFRPSAAGWWLVLVSLPMFQFLFLRWYYRIFLWARFLLKVSRLELNIVPTSPDGCGGLGFLSLVSQAFSTLLLAQGAILAGMMANRIFYAGAKLTDFKVELVGVVGVMVLAVLGPMLAFAPKLAAAKRQGLGDYGTLGARYVREFDRKWVRGGAPQDEQLLGSADIQSLADFGNSFQVVKGMRIVPFAWQTVVQLVITTLAPVAPLLLTMMPLEEVLEKLLKVVF